MQVPHCREVVNRKSKTGKTLGAEGSKLTAYHKECIVVHCRLFELTWRRVEVDVRDGKRMECGMERRIVLPQTADELSIRLVGDPVPVEEPFTSVLLQEPNKKRLAIPSTTVKEEDLSERIVFVERPREHSDQMVAVGEKM